MSIGKWWFVAMAIISIVGVFMTIKEEAHFHLITMVLSFLGLAVVERLDKLIKINEEKTV